MIQRTKFIHTSHSLFTLPTTIDHLFQRFVHASLNASIDFQNLARNSILFQKRFRAMTARTPGIIRRPQTAKLYWFYLKSGKTAGFFSFFSFSKKGQCYKFQSSLSKTGGKRREHQVRKNLQPTFLVSTLVCARSKIPTEHSTNTRRWQPFSRFFSVLTCTSLVS